MYFRFTYIYLSLQINDATSMWLLISPKETAVSKLTVRAFVKTCDRDKLDKSACIGIFTSPGKQDCPSATVSVLSNVSSVLIGKSLPFFGRMNPSFSRGCDDIVGVGSLRHFIWD